MSCYKLFTDVDFISKCEFNRLNWGLRVDPAFGDDIRPASRYSSAARDFRPIEHYSWIQTPPDAQTLGSCAFNTFAGYLEALRFAMTKKAVQYDYDAMYLDYRKWTGNLSDTGAPIDGPFKWAMATGILPEYSEAIFVPLDPRLFCAALERGPLAVGMSIHRGWAPSQLHRQNGAVNETFVPDGLNGHAMLAVATNVHFGTPLVVLRQSWGPIGINGKGLVCVTWNHFCRYSLSLPLEIILPQYDSKRLFGGMREYELENK